MPHRFVLVLCCFHFEAVDLVGRTMNDNLVGGSRRGQGSGDDKRRKQDEDKRGPCAEALQPGVV